MLLNWLINGKLYFSSWVDLPDYAILGCRACRPGATACVPGVPEAQKCDPAHPNGTARKNRHIGLAAPSQIAGCAGQYEYRYNRRNNEYFILFTAPVAYTHLPYMVTTSLQTAKYCENEPSKKTALVLSIKLL